MDKVVFNQLIIEVTRRCNMSCAHCLRGDAQNVDILGIDIDNVLNQTEAIGNLAITGGEPTLNLKALQHIANGTAKRGIPVSRVEIVTNGLIYDDRFIAIVKRFSDITHLTQQFGYGNMERETWRVQIGVSLDRYHEAQDICKKNYIKYKSALKGYAEVLRVSHGNAPRNEGRAVALTETVNFSSIINSFMLQQVEILSAQHKPMCKFYKSYHLDRPDQKAVCCGVYLNVWGEVLPGMACDTDYDCRGVRICDSYEPIWEKIIEYNRAHERQHCTYCDDLRIKSNLVRDQKEADRETALFTAPEAMDEPSSEPMYINGFHKRYGKEFPKWFLPDNYQDLERAASEKEYIKAQ